MLTRNESELRSRSATMDTEALRYAAARELEQAHLWRPYASRESQLSDDAPVFVRGEGPWLFTQRGERLFDGFGSWWVSALGHQHPRLIAALKTQAETLAHAAFAGALNAPALRLTEALVRAAPPGLSRVFFSDNGSTAVEVALKMAFQYFRQNGNPERQRFLALSGAFHGDTVGAMSVGDIPEFNALFEGLLFPVTRPVEADWEAVAEQAVDHIRAQGHELAGVIVEPMVQGASGMRFWSAAALRAVAEATREAGAWLIADEVFTGFGRTGPMWACEHAGVVPDLLCSSKGLTGGVLPFAATLANERLFEGFDGGLERAFMHGHTYHGNPLGAAVATEVLAVFEEDCILDKAAPKAVQLAEAFAALGAHPRVRGARTLGMLGAFEVDGVAGYRARGAANLAAEARKHGLWLRPLGNTVYLTPPLNVPDDDLAWALHQLKTSLESLG